MKMQSYRLVFLGIQWGIRGHPDNVGHKGGGEGR
jgi:hypothetical protein